MEERTILKFFIIDCFHLFFVKPFDTFAVFPQTVFNFVVFWDYVGAQAMLFATVPVTFVAPAISPGVDAETMFFIVFILALILSAIIPNINTHTFHIIVEPFTFISSSIKP
jgi:hypothetical protein